MTLHIESSCGKSIYANTCTRFAMSLVDVDTFYCAIHSVQFLSGFAKSGSWVLVDPDHVTQAIVL